MSNFVSYWFYRGMSKMYLARANAELKYYKSLPYRRKALDYEMKAYRIKYGNKMRF